jgi:hypothetical protein
LFVFFGASIYSTPAARHAITTIVASVLVVAFVVVIVVVAVICIDQDDRDHIDRSICRSVRPSIAHTSKGTT